VIDALLVGDGMLWTASAELCRLIGLPIVGDVPGEHPVMLRGDCDDLACDGETLWMARERSLVARSAATGAPTGRLLDVPWRVDGLAAAAGWVWAVHYDERGGLGEVRAFAPSGDVRSFPLPEGPHTVAATGPVAWVTSRAAGIVTRIDVEATTPLQATRLGRRPWSLVADAGGVWVARSDGSVVRLDHSGTPLALAEGGAAPLALALDGERLWAASLADGAVRELDAASGDPRSEPRTMPSRIDAVAAAGGEAWALCADGIALLARAPAQEAGSDAPPETPMLRLPRRRPPQTDAPEAPSEPDAAAVATLAPAKPSGVETCPDCGAEVDAGAQLCPACRYRLLPP
jgi:hypothetical protein